MENDIPKSKILNIEYYMENYAEEIVDFIERKISEKSQKEIKITGWDFWQNHEPTSSRNAFWAHSRLDSYRLIQRPYKLVVVWLDNTVNGQ